MTAVVWQFFAGVAVGVVVAMVLFVLSRGAERDAAAKAFEAEDKLRAEEKTRLARVESERRAAHDAIDTLEVDEIDRVLNGGASVADVLRDRDDKTPRPGRAPTS